MEKKKYQFTVFDSTEILPYEEYLDDCESNNREPQGENSKDYWDFVHEMQDLNVEEGMREISEKDFDVPVVITGYLGLWNGRPEIQPVMVENVKKAVVKCWGKCDDCELKFNTDHFEVRAMHHDGTNCFEIHKLSKNGIQAFERHGGYLSEVKPYMLAKFKAF